MRQLPSSASILAKSADPHCKSQKIILLVVTPAFLVIKYRFQFNVNLGFKLYASINQLLDMKYINKGDPNTISKVANAHILGWVFCKHSPN